MAMDPDIRDALADIKLDVKDGLTGIHRRIDDLVTRGEFRATVDRIDAAHGTLQRDFTAHEQKTETYMQQVRDEDNKVMDSTTKAVDAVRAEVHTALEGYKVSSRWAVGLAASIAGLIVAAASIVVNFIR
jgi:BMFP domain-containing protein YqiC